MAANKRISAEEIIAAYERTGSVWKAAKQLGVVGQSVWERLKYLNYPMPSRRWTSEELAELRALVEHCTISEIAIRLGRPYYGVAIKASRLGIATRAGNRMNRKPVRGTGLTKDKVRHLTRDLDQFKGSLRQFCRMHGVTVDSFAAAVQYHDPAWWEERSRAQGLVVKRCPHCERQFYPMNGKQRTCSRRCTALDKQNRDYFGGRRQEAIGMAEGVCQLCFRETKRGLSAHHMLGKEHDTLNEFLIALCPGCHKIVEQLATRKFTDEPRGWERLIELVLARRLPKQPPRSDGAHLSAVSCCVDVEYLTEQEWCDMTGTEIEDVA